MGFLSRRKEDRDGTTIYFATDVHGSEICFRKFINAAQFYGAGLLILGGDLTGKLVVPIVGNGGRYYVAELHGELVRLDESQLTDFEQKVANEGLYPARMTPEEHQHYEDHPEEVEQLFERLMHERLRAWIEHAHQRLAETAVQIITTPGNDDPSSIDDVIREHGG